MVLTQKMSRAARSIMVGAGSRNRGMRRAVTLRAIAVNVSGVIDEATVVFGPFMFFEKASSGFRGQYHRGPIWIITFRDWTKLVIAHILLRCL
jgi:hypothetical protein